MKNKRVKVNRNDPCPCGSGLKYKKCCLFKERSSEKSSSRNTYLQRHGIRVKCSRDVDAIKKAARIALNTLDRVADAIRPGMATDEINTLVHEYTIVRGARPAPLNYRGFPGSVCVSVNEVICHGIPGKQILENGDIVNVDVTPVLDGYYADVNKTFFVGDITKEAQKIVSVARECLRRGMMMVKPGNRLGDIGFAIQAFAEKNGCSVVREFVGHGVGFEFHEPPQVPHYGRAGEGIELIPGMVFTIEPMINLGKRDLRVLDDGWTAVTLDGALSAQFEQTILVTEDGFESLTPFSLQ